MTFHRLLLSISGESISEGNYYEYRNPHIQRVEIYATACKLIYFFTILLRNPRLYEAYRSSMYLKGVAEPSFCVPIAECIDGMVYLSYT